MRLIFQLPMYLTRLYLYYHLTLHHKNLLWFQIHLSRLGPGSELRLQIVNRFQLKLFLLIDLVEEFPLVSAI